MGYDGNGNMVSSNDRAVPGLNRAMTYDGRNRLTGATSVGGAWTNATYAYDVLDNLRANSLTMSGVTTALTYGYDSASNRLTTVTQPGATTRNFIYDARGNVRSDGVRNLTWTAADRVAAVTGKETYQYDGHGRRTVVWRADGTGSVPMYGLSGRLFLTADNRQQGANIHIYLGDDNVADVFYRWSDGQKTSTYLHTDPLGSPVARSTAARAVTRINYAPYGRMVPGMTADGTSNDINYTGHAFDSATGLVYMQQRFFDPVLGRFMSTDPMGTDRGTGWNFNRYNYSANNPYRFVDPDGRRIESKDKNERERIAGLFNDYGENTYGFNAKGHLVVTSVSTTPNRYDNMILSVINDKKLLMVDISPTIKGRDLRMEHGNAATSIITHNGGKEGVLLTLTGYPLRNDPYTGERLRYADGSPSFDTAADLLLHEFAGHGVPLFFRGKAAGSENAIDHDNAVRAQLNLRLRPADPEHTVAD
jgi:RHS repeat-associated protein